MFLSLILLTVGLFILVKGADWLVSGASAISLRLKIKPIVIGLTVVAFGTSAPELTVSITSLMAGNSGVALGNVLGSNIANILLILGVSAIIFPLYVNRNTVLKEIPMSFLAVVVFLIFGFYEFINNWSGFNLISILSENNLEGYLTRSGALILLLFFAIFVYYTVELARNTGETNDEIEKKSLNVSILLIIIGLAGLTFGSKLTVDNAVVIARTFGVSDNLIGLTLVAIGTSLPELVTSIVAALKKHVDIIVGNIIGSNIFNILFVLGISGLIQPIPIYTANIVDAFMVLITTTILIIVIFTYKVHRITRLEGIGLVFLYLAYLAFAIYRG